MATASIERRVKRLLAARAKEYEERASKQTRHFKRRRLKWHQPQNQTLWEIIRGPRQTPQYLLRQDPIDILRKGPQQAPRKETWRENFKGRWEQLRARQQG
jgi:hypothetical protein